MEHPAVHVNISVQIFREGNRFVAYSPAFDLSTSGETHAQVKQRFAEAVDAFLEECAARGTLHDALIELGWQRAQHNTSWSPPVLIEHTTQEVAIPAA